MRLAAVAALVLAAATLSGIAPLRAGALSDLVMAPGIFSPEAGTAPDRPLSYRHERRGPGQVAPVEETVSLAASDREGRRRIVLNRTRDGEPARELAAFAPEAANPVVLFFLETAARTMAEATGGSPFYIRNRIREALGAAGLGPESTAAHGDARVDVRTARLAPFAGDPNRARMGAFAELAITITVAPDLPGGILALSADIPGAATAYSERLTLIPEVE